MAIFLNRRLQRAIERLGMAGGQGLQNKEGRVWEINVQQPAGQKRIGRKANLSGVGQRRVTHNC